MSHTLSAVDRHPADVDTNTSLAVEVLCLGGEGDVRVKHSLERATLSRA